jgi:hypothetical protein
MVENLAEHGVRPSDLVPALMTTHTVANPEYDPAEAQRQAALRKEKAEALSDDVSEITMQEPSTPSMASPPSQGTAKPETFQTTSRVLEKASTTAVPGVSTSLSAADEKVTLDIRWTILCDLFLVLIADSVYDARSRVLLEMVAIYLGFGWLDLVKFEQRVSEALEIQEGVENMEQQEIIEGRQRSSRKRRYMMVGLATLGGFLLGLQRFMPIWFSRGWPCDWIVSRTTCTSDWGWLGCSLYNHRHIWNGWIPRWGRGCCGHHNWRHLDGIQYCCPGYGAENRGSPDI